VRLEGLGQLKNPMTSSRIEPATFRLVGPTARPSEMKNLLNNCNKFLVEVAEDAVTRYISPIIDCHVAA
jgi:hypothetical protein